jgi:hypothetical protein
MIGPLDFARKQMELNAEFAQYVVEHPEADALLPERSYIYFQVAGDEEFNRYSQELAERQRREEGLPTVLVRVAGLAPPQGSRLIDPVIEPSPAVA